MQSLKDILPSRNIEWESMSDMSEEEIVQMRIELIVLKRILTLLKKIVKLLM